MAKEPVRGRKSQGPQGPKPCKIEIDWSLVKKLAGLHCSTDEIACFLEVPMHKLERDCDSKFGVTLGAALKEWRKGGKVSLRRNQWKLAEKNAAMAIFLGKQYLGQIDDYSHSHKGNIPIQITNYGDGEAKKWKSPDAEKE